MPNEFLCSHPTANTQLSSRSERWMNAGTRSKGFLRVAVRLFSREKLVMAISDHSECSELLTALSTDDWSVTLEAVTVADKRLRGAIAGHPQVNPIVEK